KPMTVDDKVHLGSCTKAMTATLVAQLVNENKISWNTRLIDVFPNLEKSIHKDYHAVTIADLLSHQSAVPKNNVGGWPRGKPVRTLRFELIKKSLATPPMQPVGDFFYSNLGFITAGAMLEKVTNKKWEDLISERLFQKLGMDSAGFGPPGLKQFTVETKKKIDSKKIDQPWGHIRNLQGNWKPIRLDNPPILGPAGTVHCSIKDWAKFISLHVSWKKRTPVLLDVATLKYLQTPRSEQGNALGWFSVERNWAQERAINHVGSNTFWMANVWGDPGADFAVLTATNCCSDQVHQSLDEVALEMVRRFAR
ncbi:MAG: serine hydrolase domain-containing protein, partial [Planctomycetota bacterium]|nr:serine hydrolase domain-containing protein [Planctomycetota bacterium]